MNNKVMHQIILSYLTFSFSNKMRNGFNLFLIELNSYFLLMIRIQYFLKILIEPEPKLGSEYLNPALDL